MAADAGVSHRIFGTPGSERVVVLVGTGIGVAVDPQPSETASRDVCVLAVALGDATMEDPGGYGSETPGEQTAAWLAALIRETLEETRSGSTSAPPTSVGIVVYGRASDVALRAAAELGEMVDRLVLVAVAAPDQPLDRDDLGGVIEAVTAETLILNGQRDATAASWYENHFASARVEMIPGEGALSLSHVWGRVLSHVAPGTKR